MNLIWNNDSDNEFYAEYINGNTNIRLVVSEKGIYNGHLLKDGDYIAVFNGIAKNIPRAKEACVNSLVKYLNKSEKEKEKIISESLTKKKQRQVEVVDTPLSYRKENGKYIITAGSNVDEVRYVIGIKRITAKTKTFAYNQPLRVGTAYTVAAYKNSKVVTTLKLDGE